MRLGYVDSGDVDHPFLGSLLEPSLWPVFWTRLLIFLNDWPESCILWALCTIRSRIASATDPSPMVSCQFSTGSWEAIMVDSLLPCLSSMISSSAMRACASSGCSPKSSRISRSCFSIRLSPFRYDPSALSILSQKTPSQMPIKDQSQNRPKLMGHWQLTPPTLVSRR